MKKILCIIIILFLSYQGAFAGDSKIGHDTLKDWYDIANIRFKNGDIVSAYKYYSALVLADWGRGDKEYDKLRTFITRRMGECEWQLEEAIRYKNMAIIRHQNEVGADPLQ